MRIVILIMLLFSYVGIGQEVKFGKVTKEELAQSKHAQEPDSDAAILYKYRNTYFDFNTEKGWHVITEYQFRIKIYTAEGADWGTHNHYLRIFGNDEETLFGLKAATYNLTNGQIEKSKLKKSSIFKEKTSKYRKKYAWTMPDVRAGSIIEFKFSVRSNSWIIEDLVAQYNIPLDNLEAKIRIPEYFTYRQQTKGYYPLQIGNSKIFKKKSVIYRTSVQGGAITQANKTELSYTEDLQLIKAINIPALIEESYVNNIDNYMTALVYELAQFRYFDHSLKNYALSWSDVSKSIMASESVGGQLKKKRMFKDKVTELVGNVGDADTRMLTIFEHVKNHMTWNRIGGFWAEEGIRKAYKEQKGNVGDINLILIAMLRAAGLEADPVLVSTRSHGIPIFPTRNGFNYLIAAVHLNNGTVLLDATDINNTPNILQKKTINWSGRMLGENGSSREIPLSPNYLSSNTLMGEVKLQADGVLEGKVKTSRTKNFGLGFRQGVRGVNHETYVEQLENSFTEVEISDHEFHNLENPYKPVMETYSVYSESDIELVADKIYFSPLLVFKRTANPFKLKERLYPIDFSYPLKTVHRLAITLPEGYAVESVPEGLKMTLPDGLGQFVYQLRNANGKLQVVSTLKINVAIVGPNYYEVLKEFYAKLIEKQQEKVVLSKT